MASLRKILTCSRHLSNVVGGRLKNGCALATWRITESLPRKHRIHTRCLFTAMTGRVKIRSNKRFVIRHLSWCSVTVGRSKLSRDWTQGVRLAVAFILRVVWSFGVVALPWKTCLRLTTEIYELLSKQCAVKSTARWSRQTVHRHWAFFFLFFAIDPSICFAEFLKIIIVYNNINTIICIFRSRRELEQNAYETKLKTVLAKNLVTRNCL